MNNYDTYVALKKVVQFNNIAHHWIVAFLLFANPFPYFIYGLSHRCVLKSYRMLSLL